MVFAESFTRKFGALSSLYDNGRKFKVGGTFNTFDKSHLCILCLN